MDRRPGQRSSANRRQACQAAAPGAASAIGPVPARPPDTAERQEVRAYAEAMWNSIQLFDTGKALPSDKLCFENDGSVSRTDYTFIANVGAYVWSVLGARDLGLIGEQQARQKLLPVLDAVEKLQRDAATAGAPGGLLLWAAKVDGPRIDGSTVSSVDNAWLAAGLALMAESYPVLKPRAEALLEKMDFAAMLHPDKGQFYNNYDLGKRAFSSGTYDLLTEARIISYLAIGEGKCPARSITASIAGRSGRASQTRRSSAPTRACASTSTRRPMANIASCPLGAAACSKASCRTC